MNILENIETRILAGTPLRLSDEEIDALTAQDIAVLQERHMGNVLMHIPPRERQFFDWLKTEDPAVWTDLWQDDEDLLVTLAFLAAFKKGGTGFVICDLIDQPNYFFTPRHVKPDGMKALQTIIARAEKNEELSIAEGLLFDIVVAPTDIWHFCYKYAVPLEKAKKAVAQLAALDWIVHLPEHDDHVRYLE
jgi:hypothetical protein